MQDNFKNTHPYSEGLEKLHGKIIEVKDILGDCVRGTCIAINKADLNVILEVNDQILVIRNVQTIVADKEEKSKTKETKNGR